MPSVHITTSGARVSLVSERLRVELPPAGGAEAPAARDIPLVEVELVSISDGCHITMPAVCALLERSVPVVITTWGERVAGLCLPPAPHSAARLAQYRRCSDPDFALALAANWVEAKIANSRRVLQRLAANREDAEITPHLLAMADIASRCASARSLDTLRGYEGTAAGRYFECYGAFFPDACPFERRSRRPPHNAPNAILSYTYTLLAAETEARLHTVGLDPALGFYHEPADRRASLALDIIEPFRAPVADAMAIDLLTHGTLNPRAHFERRDGGVFLNKEGKKRFFVAYERRMEREFSSEQTGLRTTLRAELHGQCQKVKAAILNGEPFEPFLMN